MWQVGKNTETGPVILKEFRDQAEALEIAHEWNKAVDDGFYYFVLEE